MSSRRQILAFAAALFAAPALAQTPDPTPHGAPAPVPVRVALTTTEGVVVLELYPDKAPVTVANFLRYVDARKYDGAEFYRASRPATRTGLSHTDGTIALGRFAPGTAKSDFFICVGDQSYLDANPAAAGDNLGFAAFGRVVEGMEVVRRILAMPLDPQAGKGVMKGEILKAPVRIRSARRV